jgi:hypothetical protein
VEQECAKGMIYDYCEWAGRGGKMENIYYWWFTLRENLYWSYASKNNFFFGGGANAHQEFWVS